MPRRAFALAVFLTALVACADVPTGPRSDHTPGTSLRSAASPASACASSSATVVGDEATLRAALAAAQPGDVVAITGTISISSALEVEVPEGVTLTCAETGAGIVGNESQYALLYVNAPNVTIAGLVIRGAETSWPLFVFNGGARSDVSGFRLEGSTVECGWFGCLFLVNTPGSVIVDNTIEATHETGTGIHMQGAPGSAGFRTDGARIERNVVTAHVRSGAPPFGAIRPRDGSGIVVRDNVVRGPWSNGIATTEVENSTFDRNKIEGVTRFGIFFALIAHRPITVRGSLFRANDISSAGGAAVFAQRACNNVFVGNRLTPKDGHPTIAFAATTGANAVLGPVAGIQDNGNQDCDGDGITDPNTMSGKTRRGGYAGEIIADVMRNTGRVQAQ